MSVLDPDTRAETEAPGVEPPGVGPAEPAASPDHVRTHANTCYWDVTRCRWVCSAQ